MLPLKGESACACCIHTGLFLAATPGEVGDGVWTILTRLFPAPDDRGLILMAWKGWSGLCVWCIGTTMYEGTLKTSIPKCRLYWPFLFGVVRQFCRFWTWSETECKTPVKYEAGSLKMNTALEYSTRVVQEGGRRCKNSTLNDLVHLSPLRIPLMNPPMVYNTSQPPPHPPQPHTWRVH
jgi:hypothetical protein